MFRHLQNGHVQNTALCSKYALLVLGQYSPFLRLSGFRLTHSHAHLFIARDVAELINLPPILAEIMARALKTFTEYCKSEHT